MPPTSPQHFAVARIVSGIKPKKRQPIIIAKYQPFPCASYARQLQAELSGAKAIPSVAQELSDWMSSREVDMEAMADVWRRNVFDAPNLGAGEKGTKRWTISSKT